MLQLEPVQVQGSALTGSEGSSWELGLLLLLNLSGQLLRLQKQALAGLGWLRTLRCTS